MPVVRFAFTRRLHRICLALLALVVLAAVCGSGVAWADPPAASFTYLPSQPLVGSAVAFDGSSSSASSGSIAVYDWDFGDGTAHDTTTGAMPLHTYSAPGSYTVTLMVTDDSGGMASSQETVDVVRLAGSVSLSGVPDGLTTGRTLSFDAAPGVENDVTVATAEPDGSTLGSVTVSDAAGALTPGPGCAAAADGRSVICIADGPSPVSVNTGDEDDHVDLSGLGAGWNASVDPGSGDNVVTGGPGTNTIDYSSHSDPVDVDLAAGAASDNGAGGHDTLSGIENVIGGSGADRIQTRDATANHVSCRDGSDHVTSDKLDSVDPDCEAVDPFEQAAPSISGSPRDGDPLTASPGDWAGMPAPSYSYQWWRCAGDGTDCAQVADATASTYSPGHDDVGHTLYVHVVAASTAGSAADDSPKTPAVQAAAPVNAVLPTISGTAQEGQLLRVAPGTWSGTPGVFGYRWRRCGADGNGCADITGATGTTYSPAHDDVGHRLRVTVVATNAAATGGVVASSDPTGAVQAAPVVNVPVGPAVPAGSAADNVDRSTLEDNAPPELLLWYAHPRIRALIRTGLKVLLSPSEPASATARLILDAKTARRVHLTRGRKAVVVGTARHHLPAVGAPTVLHVKLTAKAKAALRRLPRVTLRLSITAWDGAGHTARPVVKRFKLRP